MALTNEEKAFVSALKRGGKTSAEISGIIANQRRGVVEQPKKQTTTFGQDALQDIKQTGAALKDTFNKTASNLADIGIAQQKGEQGFVRSAFQNVGAMAKGATDAIGNVFTGAVKTTLPQGGEDALKSGLSTVAKPIMESSAVQSVIEKYNSLDEKRRRDIDAVLGIGSLATEFAGIGAGTRLASSLTRKAIKTGSEVIDNVSDVVRGGRTFVGQGQNVKNSIIEFISPDADEITKTILRESKPDDVDKFVRIQELATKDPRAITPYESIGDSMAEATKQLQTKLNEIGKAKSDILKPLNRGLETFESKSIINDLTSLRNSKSGLQTSDIDLIDDILARAKQVKTKGGADKFIDEVQDLVYTGNRTQTLPAGSALDKQLQGIIGKYNSELKKSLPKEYAELNAKWSEIKGVTESLNSALGEVVDGVSTRGGSLVKQFFSPNGRKAKELFDYIKAETGVDLAKDATLARYVMELFDDPRARTLLGGEIPTSVSGVLDKVFDFIVDKTGAGKKVQEVLRSGSIEKAKSLTSPK